MDQEAQNQLPTARLIKRFGWLVLVMAVSTSLLFNNCDGGFKYDPKTGELSSLGENESQLKVTTFNPAGMVVPDGQSFEGGVEYRLVATGNDLQGVTLMWQLTENTGNCVMRNGSSLEVRYVLCDRSGRVSIQTSGRWPDGATVVVSSARTTAEIISDACGPSTTSRTVFRIPAGTNAGPWNSSASPVLVFVGQTLRVCNNDTRVHRLHTDGNPCPHQPNQSQPGMFYDCTIANTAGVNAATGIVRGTYDHDLGTNAAFYIRVLNGQALYADGTQSNSGQSCASCHNGFANSTRKNRSFDQIKQAIATVPEMATFQTNLSDDEIRAIAYALSL